MKQVNWTMILKQYYKVYEDELTETEEADQLHFGPWLEKELSNALEVISLVNSAGVEIDV